MTRQSNDCSTPAQRSSTAKKWTVATRSNDGDSQGRTQGRLGLGLSPPLELAILQKLCLRRVYRAWFFTKIRGVCAEEYAYYVNKLRLKT